MVIIVIVVKAGALCRPQIVDDLPHGNGRTSGIAIRIAVYRVSGTKLIVSEGVAAFGASTVLRSGLCAHPVKAQNNNNTVKNFDISVSIFDVLFVILIIAAKVRNYFMFTTTISIAERIQR